MRKTGERGPRESRIASGWTIEAGSAKDASIDASGPSGAGSLSFAHDEATQAPESASTARTQLGSGLLVLLGVIGGLYLLYTAVWFSWAKYYADLNAALAQGSGTIGAIVQQTIFWGAPFAPVLWFLSALLLNRGARPRKLVIWLLIGALVLVPLPVFNLGTSA